jgi:hypothetical protein
MTFCNAFHRFNTCRGCFFSNVRRRFIVLFLFWGRFLFLLFF